MPPRNPRATATAPPQATPPPTTPAGDGQHGGTPQPSRRRLSYNEQRELAALPARIEALEAQQAALQARTEADGFYRLPHATVDATLRELAAAGDALQAAYGRWAELER